ncbi:hypothetical protein KMP13_01290 [Epibacterium ulvae]|uniref:hypothetical protein n=1 Tax=Epibacterium ulvae TaxID=1156985 RepID=UPI001BFC3A27|nr:hypothetical protein [Epibacterium ulvae]MBT8152549.1 hypothetical protein [Epibacterium ulvae]
MEKSKLALALLIMRLSAAAFMIAWTSLKFRVPQSFENIFHKFYGLHFVTQDLAWIVGGIQMLIVLAFAIGILRTYTYGAVLLMHGVGTLSSIPNLIDYTTYPNQLMWAAVPTLGSMVALFLLRADDQFSVDGMRMKSAPAVEATPGE